MYFFDFLICHQELTAIYYQKQFRTESCSARPTNYSEHEDKLWRDTEKFKETIQKKDTELRRNEDAKRKMAADLKTKLQEKERGRFITSDKFLQSRPRMISVMELVSPTTLTVRSNIY